MAAAWAFFLLVATVAVAASDDLPLCSSMKNMGSILYNSIMDAHRPAVKKCLEQSGFRNAANARRNPNKDELGSFFSSKECREVVEAMREAVKSNSDRCVIDAYGTHLGQLATLSFDDLKLIYAPFMNLPPPSPSTPSSSSPSSSS
ncbi:hypothetical protein AC1031_020377 [Aphanomyces cochlioides]|nr:hypothetical protein AC1031_020377 [Aphanomyces cochlioides]